MTDDSTRVVIVGAGHGGTASAALLRQHGFTGEVILLGAEPHSPYQRPPLSKTYLLEESAAPAPLRPPDFYRDQRIDLRLNTVVAGLDPAERTLLLGDGSALRYTAAILATGARPRALPIPGADLGGVHTLRTFDDALALRRILRPGARLVIVGGGYIGLEMSAMARRLGVAVTLLEKAERVLGRSAGAFLAQWLTEHHSAQGTDIAVGTSVERFVEGDDGRVAEVVLTDGRQLPCDAALVGAGSEPRDELARRAGITCDGGIVVDHHGRTSDPHVYAIGDATRRPVCRYPGAHRLESIPSAGEQAKQAVAEILGLPAPKPEVPWFWSDQGSLKLQIAGLPGLGEKAVLRGDPARDSFAVFHLDGADRLVAVEALNATPAFMAGKKLIGSASTLDADRIADPTSALRELAAH